MNKKLKIILILVFLAIVTGAGYYFLLRNEDQAGNTVADNTFGWKYPTTMFPDSLERTKLVQTPAPSFPITGQSQNSTSNVWIISAGIFIALVAFLFIGRSSKISKKTKIILIIILLAGLLGAGYYFLFRSEDQGGNTVADALFGWKYPVTKFPLVGVDPNQLAYSSIRDPGGIPEGLPIRLKIPVIGVSSAIEDALITPDGRMDVPSGSVNVAWFALGPHPGRTGSAVIGGHFGIRNGYKFVFYDLDKLVVGDKVYIEDDKGETLTFQVRRIQLFDRNADATTVFTSDDGLAHLNLITCEGIWNRVNDAYPSRRVVFTDLVGTEGVSPAGVISPGVETPATPIISQFGQTLRVGSRGADVSALQDALNIVGITKGVVDGVFGGATHSAVARYQSSAGLSPDGVFGPSTRAKLALELAADTNANLPNAGEDKPVVVGETPNILNDSPSSSKTFIASFKGLYATKVDGIITTLLIIAIIFMAFKIIR